ncbi:MBL fold metallo-hydrolase [Nocardia brasiliensis]
MRVLNLGHAAFLVDTGTERILIDPWLTARLDRLWEHWPALPDTVLAPIEDLDAIIFTHHHFDHHHFPSLSALDFGVSDVDEVASQRSTVRCFYPQRDVPPRFTVSGLGHQAIAWTLRRLGFDAVCPVSPGDVFRLEHAVIRTFASRTPFPEMSILIETRHAAVMFCGDSLLHPTTVDWFSQPNRRRVDLAFVPAHSISPAGVLTERRPVPDILDFQERSHTAFERYVDLIDARTTVPSSFGWRVRAEDETNSFDWVNQKIFPFTPAQALAMLDGTGRTAFWCGPGDVILIEPGSPAVLLAVPQRDIEETYQALTFDGSSTVPPFDAQRDTIGRQTCRTAELLDRFLAALVGSEAWYQTVQTGRQHIVELSDDLGSHVYVLDLVRQTVVEAATRANFDAAPYTAMSAPTLQALLDAELLIGSSYGLWVSNDSLLSAVFHQPRFYVSHVERWLRGER